jgi:hypothetical protein
MDVSLEWIAFSGSTVAESGFGVDGALDWERSEGAVRYRTRQANEKGLMGSPSRMQQKRGKCDGRYFGDLGPE